MNGARARVWVVVCVCSAAALSCTEARTEIVVVVDTDMVQGPGEELSAIRVRVLSEDEPFPRFDQRFELGVGADPIMLPSELGVLPRDGGRDLVVEVDANRDDTLLFTQRAETEFVEGRTLALEMFLAGACVMMDCDPGSTCVRGACQSTRREDLPDHTPP